MPEERQLGNVHLVGEAPGQEGVQRPWLCWGVAVFGHAWPFAVALFGIVLTISGFAASPFSDAFALVLLGCSFMGTPAVVESFYRWQDDTLPEGSRFVVAVLLAVPCVLVEVALALMMFAIVCVVE
jgi:hypothetical protein